MSGNLPARALSGQEAPVRQRAQLCAALALVEQMAGKPDSGGDADTDDDARTAAYMRAAPIARRRFDALLGEAGIVASAGITALVHHRDATGQDCAPAAEHLAAEMRRAIAAMDRLVTPG